MNSKYILYLFRNRKIAVVFFLVLYTAFSMTTFIGAGSYTAKMHLHDVMVASTVMSFIMAYGLPILIFSYVHMKRSADTFFAIPVSRKDQLKSNILFMFALCYGYFLIATLIGGIFTSFGNNIRGFLTVQLAAAFVLLVLLLINSSLYLLANNVFDGIVMIGAYTLLPLLIFLAIDTFQTEMIAGSLYGDLSLDITGYVFPAFQAVTVMRQAVNAGKFGSIYVLLLAVYGLVSICLLKRNFIDRKAERAEQLSDEIMAYPFVIRIYTLIFMLIITCCPPWLFFGERIIYYLLLLFVFVVAVFVYKRKIEIKMKNLLIFAGCLAAAFIFNSVAWNTHGFGYADNYTINEKKYLAAEFDTTVYSDNLEKMYTWQDDQEYQDNAYLTFQMILPLDETEKYKEVLDLLDKKRHESIDKFYENNKRNEPHYSMTLSFSNLDDADIKMYNEKGYYIGSNRYSYRMAAPFTLEELKLLDQYGNLSVIIEEEVVSSTGEDTWIRQNTYTLNEFLEVKAS